MSGKLHPEHGVNPTIPQCFFCGEDKNELILLGAAYKDKAPMRMIVNKEPCDECKKLMEMGVILVSIRNGDGGKDNPYRTGCLTVVKDEAIRRVLKPDELADHFIKTRFGYIEDEAWDLLGLPREDFDNRKESE